MRRRYEEGKEEARACNAPGESGQQGSGARAGNRMRGRASQRGLRRHEPVCAPGARCVRAGARCETAVRDRFSLVTAFSPEDPVLVDVTRQTDALLEAVSDLTDADVAT